VLTTTGAIYACNGSVYVAAGGGGSGDVVGPASAADNEVAIYDSTTGKLIKRGTGCTIASSELTCTGGFTAGAGTSESAIILKELAANGTNDFRIYGAASQATDGCIVLSGALASGDALRGSATTVTIDGKTCRVMETYTPNAGGGSLTWSTPIGNRSYLQGTSSRQSTFLVSAGNTTNTVYNEWQGVDGVSAIPYLAFTDGGTAGFVWSTKVPAGYTSGNLTIALRRSHTSGANAVRWTVKTFCPGALPGLEAEWAWNAATSAEDTVSVTTLVSGNIATGVAMTGCSAGSWLLISVQREGGHANDTNTGVARIYEVTASL
jgi:hypothetical protein